MPTAGGAARLARHLPSVAAALAETGEAWEIVVVDDGCGGLGPLPVPARVLALAENAGYGPAVNAGAQAARGDYLLVLNDDVDLDPGSVRTLLARFPNPELLAVVPAILSPLAACGDEGGKRPRWRAGEIEIEEAPPAGAPQPTLYPVGCCFLCRRDDFLALGGFDATYAPFFWEDVDLGYRAWLRGLSSLHDPGASCRHEGSATLRERHGSDERERVSFRNRVLFHLRRLAEPARRAESYGAWAARLLFEPHPARLAGLADALSRYDGVRGPHAAATESAVLSRFPR
jgi:GT2 family glycosyltransferase